MFSLPMFSLAMFSLAMFSRARQPNLASDNVGAITTPDGQRSSAALRQ